MGESLVVLVPDTNVLLQAQALDYIPWPAIVGAERVEIVLVSQVLHELDLKKNGDNPRLRGRARRVSTQLNEWFPPKADLATIRPGVTLRVRVKEPGPIAGLDFSVGDDRIVGAAIELHAETTTPVVIVTNDTTLRFKAEGRDLAVFRVPEQYEVREDEEPRKPASPKTPRLQAAVFGSDRRALKEPIAMKLGLSAKHLLADAEESLRIARSASASSVHQRELASRRLLGIGGFDDDAPPTVEAWEYYIRQITDFDKQHAKTLELVIGIVNDGSAPADDVLVEFCFPPEVYVHESEPSLPSRPRGRLRNFFFPVPQPPHPLEQNEKFTVDWDGDAGALAQIRIRRLLHSRMTAFRIWAEIHDESVGGFPIKARILAGAPPIALDSMLNIRLDR